MARSSSYSTYAPQGRSAFPDIITLGLVFILTVFGILVIHSAESPPNQTLGWPLSASASKQLLFLGIFFILGVFILFLDPKVFGGFAFILYGASIVLLILTLFIGTRISGALGWIKVGGFTFQSAEFAKYGCVLALGKWVSANNFSIKNRRDFVIALAIILVPMFIILALQNDTGSAMVFFAFFLMLLRVGLNPWIVIIPGYILVLGLCTLVFGQETISIAILGIIAVLYMIFARTFNKMIAYVITYLVLSAGIIFGVEFAMENVLQQHQRERIEVLIGQRYDPQKAGYNVHQSLIAIGSGGAMGKGYLNGTQTKFRFVPEQNTDFIYCTVAEEFGFLGSVGLILIFSLLFYRLIFLAERQKSIFNRAVIYGVLSVLFLHFMINLGMTMGLFPIIGIPLPFISYGGSSLLFFSLMIFTVVRLDMDNQMRL